MDAYATATQITTSYDAIAYKSHFCLTEWEREQNLNIFICKNWQRQTTGKNVFQLNKAHAIRMECRHKFGMDSFRWMRRTGLLL